MADEINISAGMSMTNGNVGVQGQLPNYKVTQTTASYAAGIQTVGFAAHEPLDLGDVTTPGFITIYNTDPDYAVEIGKDVAGLFDPAFVIEPGESFGPAKIASGQTLYVKADTANVSIDRKIFST